MNWARRRRHGLRRTARPIRTVRDWRCRRARAERNPRAPESRMRGLYGGNEESKGSDRDFRRRSACGHAFPEAAAAAAGVGGGGAARVWVVAVSGVGAGARVVRGGVLLRPGVRN